MFHFKCFSICDDACAMKLGTDAVLLGAWADLSLPLSLEDEQPCCIDVGAGSGIISLMLAQRFNTWTFNAIEIDKKSANQAFDNIQNSSYSQQIFVINDDFLSFSSYGKKYKAIVSNPPYFLERTHSPVSQRALARHQSSSLTLESLTQRAAELLHSQGSFQLIIPYAQRDDMVIIGSRYGFFLKRECSIQTTSTKPPKRTLLHFNRIQPTSPIKKETLILTNNGTKSKEYVNLCKDFYI